MNYNKIYDSGNCCSEVEVKFDCVNQTPVCVLFEKENIVLCADTFGNAVFSDIEGNELLKGKANGKGRNFSKIYVSIKDAEICVRFPIIETIDHYPNCDGEYDRYSERIIDNINICCPK